MPCGYGAGMTKEEIDAEGREVQEALANLLMPIMGAEKCRSIIVTCLWEHEPGKIGHVMAANFRAEKWIEPSRKFLADIVDGQMDPDNARMFRAKKPTKN